MSIEIPNLNLDALNHDLGERLNFDVQTGMLHFEYPLPFPQGRENATPSFAISYTQSSTNSVFGRGWSGGLVKVARRTKNTQPMMIHRK